MLQKHIELELQYRIGEIGHDQFFSPNNSKRNLSRYYFSTLSGNVVEFSIIELVSVEVGFCIMHIALKTNMGLKEGMAWRPG